MVVVVQAAGGLVVEALGVVVLVVEALEEVAKAAAAVAEAEALWVV